MSFKCVKHMFLYVERLSITSPRFLSAGLIIMSGLFFSLIRMPLMYILIWDGLKGFRRIALIPDRRSCLM